MACLSLLLMLAGAAICGADAQTIGCPEGPTAQDSGVCKWVDSCPSNASCVGRCLVNDQIGTKVYLSLNDNSYEAGSWKLCPELTKLIRIVRVATSDAADSTTPSADAPTQASAATGADNQGDADAAARRRRVLLQEATLKATGVAAAAAAASETEVWERGSLGIPEPSGRRLLQRGTGGQVFAVPELACPSEDEVLEVANGLADLGFFYESILAADEAGQPLSEFQARSDSILRFPNKYRVISPFLKSPVMLSQYMAAECMTASVPGAVIGFDFLEHLPPGFDRGTIPDGANVTMCLQKQRGYERFQALIRGALPVCYPPFGGGGYGTCHTQSLRTAYMSSTQECARALTAPFNASSTEPLQQVADHMATLQAQCNSIAIQERCQLSDNMAVLNGISTALALLPHKVELPATAVTTYTNPTTVVLSVLGAEAPAVAPAAPGAEVTEIGTIISAGGSTPAAAGAGAMGPDLAPVTPGAPGGTLSPAGNDPDPPPAATFTADAASGTAADVVRVLPGGLLAVAGACMAGAAALLT